MTQAWAPSLFVPTTTYASRPNPRSKLQSRTAWSSELPHPYINQLWDRKIRNLLLIGRTASNAILRLFLFLVLLASRMELDLRNVLHEEAIPGVYRPSLVQSECRLVCIRLLLCHQSLRRFSRVWSYAIVWSTCSQTTSHLRSLGTFGYFHSQISVQDLIAFRQLLQVEVRFLTALGPNQYSMWAHLETLDESNWLEGFLR